MIFDKVIGYEKVMGTVRAGLLAKLDPMMPTHVVSNGADYYNHVPRHIESACRLLIRIASDEAKERLAMETPLPRSGSEILQAMAELGATIDCVLSREEIMRRVGGDSDGKDSIKKLHTLGLVGTKKGTGYYLTEFGVRRVKRIVERVF